MDCLLDRTPGYVDKSFQKNNTPTDYEGFRAYLLTVTTDILRSSPVRGLRPVTGLRRALFFLSLSLQVIFDGICRTS